MKQSETKLIVLAGLVAVFVAGLCACSRPQRAEFRGLEKIDLIGATLEGELVFTGQAVFFNPNSVGLDVTGMDLEVFINDKKVADVEQSVSLEAKAQSEFVLPLEIRVPISDVYSDIGDLLGSFLSTKVVDLKVQGEVRVKVLGVTFGVPFSHEEQHELDMGN